jgi:hypothetical protein
MAKILFHYKLSGLWFIILLGEVTGKRKWVLGTHSPPLNLVFIILSELLYKLMISDLSSR